MWDLMTHNHWQVPNIGIIMVVHRPICESSDVFGKAVDLNGVKRGDLIALRSAGAYGEIMASGYNCRELPQGYTSDELV